MLPAFLLGGVIMDAITFRTIQLNVVFIILGVYIVLAGFAIAFMNYYDSSGLEYRTIYWSYLRLYVPLLIQFTFGALLSASLIFYWFSGAFSASWPFVLVIAGLMVSNDIFRKYYLKPIVQIGVYFFILFSISVLFLSFLLNTVSAWPFVLGGFVSLGLISLYIYLLSRIVPSIKRKKAYFVLVIAVIFSGMYFLYFANIIPPIPLALREAGVYHSIERKAGKYILISEVENFFDKIIPGQTVHIKEGEKVYVYSAIFAPSDLEAKIYHSWQYHNGNEWIDRDRVGFSIVGGRDNGFRGYSFKTNPNAGSWRVLVETERGQVVGRVKFEVEKVEEKVDLIKVIK
ncbi:MAG: DUF2914 domain-containing protein [Candidatus Magasanikbacteria bacterium]|nr:DUF2914 domain-containing protein [Candidatus Magasanikbacteria bacterium]